ncbi:MAG TPA: hypothetical protein VHA15_00850 [Burkholderiales bacterium]|nr:hypothetical protein [Burkholderiales bacterium]
MKFIGQLLSQHLARYPRMQLEDVYKLLHQAALGPGHAVEDAAAVRERLEAEAASLRGGFEDPARDIISPDGKLARVHLRPWIASGGSLDRLGEAFVATANAWVPARDKLAKFCGCLGDLAATGALPFPEGDVVAWFDRIAAAGYPAVRHSVAYSQNYQPAYRVVSVDFLDAS